MILLGELKIWLHVLVVKDLVPGVVQEAALHLVVDLVPQGVQAVVQVVRGVVPVLAAGPAQAAVVQVVVQAVVQEPVPPPVQGVVKVDALEIVIAHAEQIVAAMRVQLTGAVPYAQLMVVPSVQGVVRGIAILRAKGYVRMVATQIVEMSNVAANTDAKDTITQVLCKLIDRLYVLWKKQHNNLIRCCIF
jgi:hypothetical protein